MRPKWRCLALIPSNKPNSILQQKRFVPTVMHGGLQPQELGTLQSSSRPWTPLCRLSVQQLMEDYTDDTTVWPGYTFQRYCTSVYWHSWRSHLLISTWLIFSLHTGGVNGLKQRKEDGDEDGERGDWEKNGFTMGDEKRKWRTQTIRFGEQDGIKKRTNKTCSNRMNLTLHLFISHLCDYIQPQWSSSSAEDTYWH